MTDLATDEFAAFIGLDWPMPNMISAYKSLALTSENSRFWSIGQK